ncbi:sensor histidine kinase [Polaromonas jejuensis]|uniref:histidine kinase n=1 Tax=Polaromonas jejuensis TaxID=457502 RepID=A0ABW0QEZ3_9BURK|nr:sensor histidine kinase [Polaromonas jejuensis]
MRAAGRSLYTRLALRVGLVLSISGLVLLVAIVLSTRLAASDAYDRILTGSALLIAENTWYQNGTVNVDTPVSAFSMLTANDQVFYAVLDPAGRVVAGDPEFRPAIPWERLAEGPVVIQGRYLDLPVSIAFVGRRMPVAGNPWAVVMLAQTNNARESFAKSLGSNASLVILVMGLLTVIAALFTLHQALAPLKQISAAIQHRDLNDLSPLTQEVPAEIHTLVASINEFMRRLGVHRALMRRVIGDAAHQLRTPVAALLSQMELLSMQHDDAGRALHQARLRELTHHLGELVNQLINHAMVQHRADSAPLETMDLAGLAREEMADMLSQHAQRKLDLALQAPAQPCLIQGDPVSLREALKNVLDNALKYGARTLLHINISRSDAAWELRVEDDGPGIPEADWERIRKPFSARGGNRLGASLGLSIVEEVMRAHRGDMRFGRNGDQHFVVTLRFRADHAGEPGPQALN